MGRSLTIRINKNSLMYFITIIPFIPIDFISNHFSIWTSICSYARILILAFFLIRLLFFRRNLTVPLILALLIVASALLSALMVNENYNRTFYYSIYLIGVTLLIEDGLHFDKTALINGLLVYFEILVYVNLIYFIIFPQGYYPTDVNNSPHYFFGNYNTTIKYLMPGVPLGILRAFRSKERITVRLCLMLAAMFVFFVGVGSLTNMIGLAICIIGLLWYNFRKKTGVFRYEIFLIVSVVLTFVFAISGRFMVFSNLIINVFNKDMTLSTRTYIWRKAISLISQKPVWGYGQTGNEVNRLRMGGDAAHNIFLDTLYNGGIVGLIILLFIITIVGIRLFQCRKMVLNVAVAFDCVFCGYFIMWTFNPYGDIHDFYLMFAVLVMTYHCKELVPYIKRSG